MNGTLYISSDFMFGESGLSGATSFGGGGGGGGLGRWKNYNASMNNFEDYNQFFDIVDPSNPYYPAVLGISIGGFSAFNPGIILEQRGGYGGNGADGYVEIIF